MKNKFLFYAIALIILLIPQYAFAADVLSNFFTRAATWLTGPGGRGIGLIAVAIGFIDMMFTHQLDKRKWIVVLVAIVGLLGAASIYKWAVGT